MTRRPPRFTRTATLFPYPTRFRSPDGVIAVALLPNEEGVTPAMVAVDGAPVGGAFPAVKDGRTTASGNAAAAIAYALANGQRLTVRDPGGAVLATISLAGASASLRYIDAEQIGRAHV